MRIRLSLTLRIDREPTGVTDDGAPYVQDQGAAAVERAEWHPIGFAIDPVDHPQD